MNDRITLHAYKTREGGDWIYPKDTITLDMNQVLTLCKAKRYFAVQTIYGDVYDIKVGWRDYWDIQVDAQQTETQTETQTQSQGASIMDKNIAALMREDTKTVSVRFFQDCNQNEVMQDSNINESLGLGSNARLSPKLYTYVTNFDLKIGDFCVVFVEGMLRCVVVETIDKDCAIEPNSSIQYKWIAAKVDMSAHIENFEKNKQITDLVANAYKKNVRAQFSQLLLASMDDDSKKALSSLIIGENNGNT